MLQEIIEMLDRTVLTNDKRSLPANFYSAIDRRLAMFTQRRMAFESIIASECETQVFLT